MNLHHFYPSAADLEAAPVHAVAGAVLKVLHARQSLDYRPTNVRNFILETRTSYARWESAMAVAEAWAWLQAECLICQAPEHDLGWYLVTRAGAQAAAAADFQAWAEDRDLPLALVHRGLRGACMTLFRQGQYDTAVFQAFKELEVSIRKAAGLGNDLVGVQLARKAFHAESGPLTDHEAEGGEREALMHLMSGAIGSYKNPQSHRHVGVEAAEAREMIILASHLLKIVDSRRASTA